MKIVDIPSGLTERNARIRRRSTAETIESQISGVVSSGFIAVDAFVSSSSNGEVSVQFQIEVPSITADEFKKFMREIDIQLGGQAAHEIAHCADVEAPEPPPARRMAKYVACFFGRTLLGGVIVSNQALPFSVESAGVPGVQECLRAIRALDVVTLRLRGSLKVGSASELPSKGRAYVPITSLEFKDGLIVPFAGYSDNLIIEGLEKAVPLPLSLWREPAAAARSNVARVGRYSDQVTPG
jgi:hypothetical protein